MILNMAVSKPHRLPITDYRIAAKWLFERKYSNCLIKATPITDYRLHLPLPDRGEPPAAMIVCLHGGGLFLQILVWITEFMGEVNVWNLQLELLELNENGNLVILITLRILPERKAFLSTRYENGSMIITTNRNFEDCGELFWDKVIASAIIDRNIHHAFIVRLHRESIVSGKW